LYQNRKKHNLYRNPKIYYSPASSSTGISLSPKIIRVGGVVVLFLAVCWFLFFSSYLSVKNIEISGSLNPEVKKEIDNFYGKNILTFSPGKIKNDLIVKQSSIKDIEIYRGLPNTLKVQVSVREPVLGWKSQDKKYFIDKNGVAFELNDTDLSIIGDKKIPNVEDTKNIAVEPGKEIVTEDFVLFMQNFSEKLKNDFNIQVNAIKVSETTFQAEIETDQGFRLIVSTISSLDNELKSLKRVLDEKRPDIHEYADLRIEGRVYYK